MPKDYKKVKINNKIYNLIPLNTTINSLKAFKVNIKGNYTVGEKIKVEVVTFEGNATLIPFDAILTLKDNYILRANTNNATPIKINILATGTQGAVIKNKIDFPIIVAKPDILLKIKAGYPISVK